MLSTQRTNSLLAEYDRRVRSVRMDLLKHYPAKVVWGAFAQARLEFTRLIPKIPHIGENHIWQSDLDTSAMTLALCQSLKKYGFSSGEIVQWIYDIYDAYLNHYPAAMRWGYRQYYFSSLYKERLRREAFRSHLCQYPAGWVFSYIDGNGKAFDFGVDIHECAIQKFYRQLNAEELTPSFCLLDHAMGERLGLGFYRQGTLTGGATSCDCRWKLGAQTQRCSLAPELLFEETISE